MKNVFNAKKLISQVLVAAIAVLASYSPAVLADDAAILESNGGERVKSGYTLTAKLPDGSSEGITSVEFMYLNGDEYVAVTDDEDTTDNTYVITNSMSNKTLRAFITTDEGEFTTNTVYVGENLSHVPTAPAFVEITPDEYRFTIGLDGVVSQELALLDYDVENGKSLIMRIPPTQVDTTPFYENDADDTTQRAIISVTDPRSIVYKMNMEENLEKYSLPSAMHDYILTSAWETEAGKTTMDKSVSNMQNDTVIFSKIAPISGNEYNRYSDRVGINDVHPKRGITFRSTSPSNGKTEIICGTEIWTMGKVTSTNTYIGYYTWRSIFWVDNSIFEAAKLSAAGSAVVENILGGYSVPELIEKGYTENELIALGFDITYPVAENLYIKGMNSVGSELEAMWDYTHTGALEYADAKYQWYRVDTDGYKIKIIGATSKKYSVTNDDLGYKLCFSVIPEDVNSNIGRITYSPESEKINNTSVAVKYDDVKIESDGTASVSYTLDRLNDSEYKAMLWTYSDGILLDYAEAVINTDEPCIISTEKTGTDIYAVSIVAEKNTNIPVFSLSAGDENKNLSADSAPEGYSVVPNPVEESYTFYAINENISLGDIYNIIVEDTDGMPVINVAAIAENGSGAVRFTFPEGNAPGDYVIKIYNSNRETITPIDLFYTTNEEKVNFLKALSPIEPEKFAEELIKNDNLNMNIVQITDKYVPDMDKNALASVGEYLEGKAYHEENYTDFYSDLRNAAALYMLKSAAGIELDVADYYSDVYKFDETALYEEYEKMENKENVIALFNGYDIKNVEKAQSIFTENVLIEMINTAQSYGKIMNCFKDYEEYFTFDLSEYKSSDKEEAALYILEKAGSYKAMGEIEEDLEDAINKQESSSSASSGSSGKRGSSGGKVLSSIEITPSQTVLPQTQSFNDVSNSHWAADYIFELKNKSIVNGDADGNFNPENKILREEFVKMLVIALGYSNQSSKCTFSDVADDHWAKKYIIAAVENNLISGTGDGNFGMGSYLTRQDMAVIISRIDNKTDADAQYLFTDGNTISDYAKKAVYTLSKKGIINGFEDGSFRPFESATRAQTAKMIYQLVAPAKN